MLKLYGVLNSQLVRAVVWAKVRWLPVVAMFSYCISDHRFRTSSGPITDSLGFNPSSIRRELALDNFVGKTELFGGVRPTAGVLV